MIHKRHVVQGEVWTTCRSMLVQRALGFGAAHAQLLDLIFQEELLALQGDDVKIVGSRMMRLGFDFSLKSFVTALEFRKMAMHRHRAIPLEVADDLVSVPESPCARKRKIAAL
jgi:hypothetical protein